MRVTVDLLDTQLLVYAANETDDWATTLHRQILGGQRYVYVPPYVTTEFHRVMSREHGARGKRLAWNHLVSLSEADAAAAPHHNRFRVDRARLLRQDTCQTVATICEMDNKDAPILAAAHSASTLVSEYNPPSRRQTDVPNGPPEFELVRRCRGAGIDEVEIRVLTNETNFVGVDPQVVGLDRVSISHVPSEVDPTVEL
jgi:predicted nucleic acid-binding protein